MKPAAAYLRRSTDDLQPQSIEDQRRDLIRYAEENGFRIVREYVDDGISGTESEHRGDFSRMIRDAEERRDFRVVLVWNQDRFSRMTADETGYYRTRLARAGVSLFSVTEPWANGDDIGSRIARGTMQEVKHEHVRDMARGVIRGQFSNVTVAHSDPGRRAPYGYDRMLLNPDGSVYQRIRWVGGGVREVYTPDGILQRRVERGQRLKKEKSLRAVLAPGDETAVSVVRDMYRLAIEGFGFKRIADYLNSRACPGPNGGTWAHTAVRAILSNPAYKGAIRWNYRSEGKFFMLDRDGNPIPREYSRTESGQIRPEKRPPSEWVIVDDAHEALIDPDIWERAQVAVRKRSRKKGWAGAEKGRFLFSGLMGCANCGHSFWGYHKTKGKRDGKPGTKRPYYVCSGYHSRGRSTCVSAHVPGKEAESWILARLRLLILGDGEGVREAVKRFVDAALSEEGREDATSELARLESERDRIDRTIKALLSEIDPENIPLLNGRLSELRERRDLLEERRREAESAGGLKTTAKELRAFARERLHALDEVLTGSRSDAAAREMLASYIEKIVIHPKEKKGEVVLNADAIALWGNKNPADAEAKAGYRLCGRGDWI